MRTLPRLLIAAALAAAPAGAQVLISEINLTPQNASDDRWIEIVNVGSTTADLANWSIYYASKTPGMPGNYWWAFPSGASIRSGEFLLVHWFAPYKPPTQTDIYTGDHILHFLFGYGGEALQKSAGAIGLLSSTSNAQMNDPAIYRDWVAWGGTGFKREDLAIQNQRWIAGQFVPAPTGSESIALDYNQQVEPTPATAFFLDVSPTPGAPNAAGTLVRHYGTPCAVGSVNTPTLSVLSPPVAGNTAFGFRVQGTNGTTQSQLVALLFGLQDLPGTVLPTPVFTCPIWVSLQGSVIVTTTAASGGQNFTDIPMSLGNLVTTPMGGIFVQALILLSPPTTTDHAGSAGIEFRIGR